MDVMGELGELVLVKRKKCGEQQKRKPSLLSKTMVYLCHGQGVYLETPRPTRYLFFQSLAVSLQSVCPTACLPASRSGRMITVLFDEMARKKDKS